jgi:serine/threonine protein kinase
MSLEKIGRFNLVSEIRKYRSGSLYKASDPIKGEVVAIRTLRPASDDPQSLAAVRQLFQHAKNTSVLKCENIAAVHGGGEEQGLLYVVLEYVEGISVRDMLAKNDGFSAWDLADISRQVCRALDHASSRGIAHPNLHPGNIVETWDGTIKIMGFDLVTDTDRMTPAKFPESAHYWSPEKAKRESLDCRSNLFSWGAILYEMLTKRKAFDGEALGLITSKILSEAPPEPIGTNSNIDTRLAAAVMKALCKPPAERYQSGAELVSALEECSKNKITPPVPLVFNPLVTVQPSETQTAAPPNAPGRVLANPEKAEPLQAPAGPMSPTAQIDTPPATSISHPPATPIAARTIAKTNRPQPANLLDIVQGSFQSVHAFLSESGSLRFYAKLAGCVFAAVILLLAASRFFSRPLVENPLTTAGATELPEWKDPLATSSPTPSDTNLAPVIEDSSATAGINPPTVETKPSRARTRNTKPRNSAASTAVPVISTGELVVDSSPQGASIEIDGQRSGGCVTPCSISGLTAGPHVVSLTKAGYTLGSRPVEVTAGGRSIIALQLAPAAATVTISSNPVGASVYVDGKNTGRVTPVQLSLPKGNYTFLLQMPGHLEAGTTAELHSGQLFQFAPALVPLGNVQAIRDARKLSALLGRGSKEMGRVQIKIRPKGSQIEVNQRTMEKTTPAEFLFPPGSYKVKITQAGYKPLEKVISVTAGSSTELNESLQQ